MGRPPLAGHLDPGLVVWGDAGRAGCQHFLSVPVVRGVRVVSGADVVTGRESLFRFTFVKSKSLGWRFVSVRVGRAMLDWRWLRTTRYVDLWLGNTQLHLSFGDCAGTGGTRYGVFLTKWTNDG